jgi:hypothetical protein
VARTAQRGIPSLPSIGRRTLAAVCCIPLAAAALSLVAAHGGGNGSAEAAATRISAPACASVERGTTAPPPEISAAVLPPETVITSVKHPRPGMTLVYGVVSAPFRSAVEFYVTKLPAAGYVNTVGDAEMDEAESLFVGAGMHGKWKVHGIPLCANAVKLALYVAK